ncbi:hypothetical protein [Streptomyces sp. H27-S2]|uniref:hypothetical protein n=1 Tax=Streptomyces antarcticus TaxID=2996458 RepID=UPI00226F8C29|nr:hypothetical protein [Streptomyces sp. H27-S2]MCY0952697.1 hypothetical protein [Streptomyces sp. H27-S2]
MSSGIPAGYLRRLGVTGHGRPCAEGLFALQRAHLERVAYDNIDIQLGRPPGIDPERSARRVAAGGGGYLCCGRGRLRTAARRSDPGGPGGAVGRGVPVPRGVAVPAGQGRLTPPRT